MQIFRRSPRALPALLAVTLMSGPALAAEVYVFQMPLEAKGTLTHGHLSVSPAAKNFGTVVTGGSAGASVQIRNDGQDSVALNGIATALPFSQSHNCPAVLDPGASCSAAVTFAPAVAGDFNGALSVSTPDGPLSVSLGGRAELPATSLSLSRASVDFSNADIGSPAAHKSLTVTNTGNSPASVSGIGVTDGGSDFAQSNDCGAALVPHASCTVNISFVPTAYGARSGNLVIYDATAGTLYNEALQGFGNGAVLVASPAALAFPDMVVATTPLTLKATVTNNGNLAIAGLATQISGPTADFSITASTCGASLAAGASCEVTVSFTPASAANRSATLNVTASNAPASAIGISGKALAQSLQLTAAPAAATFGATAVGASADQAITLTNTGNVSVSVAGLSVVAGATDFAQSNNCGTIAAGASCKVDVRFAPKTRGSREGAVYLKYGTEEMTFSLTGQGLQGVATLGPNALDFGSVRVAQAAPSKSVTVTNSGDAPLVVDGVTVPAGDYSVTSNCGTLAIGASCTAAVGFTPSSLGAKTKTLTISSDAGPSTVALTGAGTKGQASTSVSALSFTAQQVASTSPVQAITVTNTGTSALAISGAGMLSGGTDFSQSNNCATVEVGATCTISVAFTPSAAGNRTGVLAFTHDGDGVTTVDLAGDARAASVSLVPPTFAAQQVATGATADAILTNTGVGPVSVTAPGPGAVSGADFRFSSTTCTGTLGAGASCTVGVAFTPSTSGARSGSLAVNTTAGTSTVALSGAGKQGSVSASAASLNFAMQQVASSSAVQSVTLTNTGTSAITVTGVGLVDGGSDFAQSNNCASIAVNDSCTVSVTFTPSAAGARTGLIALTHDGSGLTTIDLAGSGQAQGAALSVPSFAVTQVGSSSTGTATLTNTGIGALSVTAPTAASVSGSAFSLVSTTCGVSVAAGGSCVVTVRFTPTGAASSSGTLVLSTGAGTRQVDLGSTGIQGFASVNPSSLTFATQQTGTSAGVQVVTVTNTGSSVLTFSGVGVADGASDFAQSNNCGSVAVNGTCTVSVSFTPSAAGVRAGTLSFVHDGGGIANVNLVGTGQAPSASITSTAWSSAQVGDTKAFFQTITNTGLGTVTLTGTPSVNAPFSYVSNDCPAQLGAGASCKVNLTFTPAAAQAYTQTLTVPTSAGVLTSSASATGVASSLVAITSGNLGTNLTPQTDSGWHQTFKNNGIGNVSITGVPSVSGGVINAYVSASSPSCYNGLVLTPGSTCVVWVGVRQLAGTYSGTLTLPSSVGNVTLPVSGTVLGGLSVSSTAFGGIAPGSTKDLTVTVSNTAAWASRTMSYAAAAPFSIVANTCGTTIAANSSCTMTVRFTAGSTTDVSGNYVTVTGNYARIIDPGVEELALLGTPLTANGVMSGRAVYASLTYAPTSLAFGNVQIGQSSAKDFVLTNTGNITATGLAGVPVAGYSAFGTGANPCSSTLAPGASCTATVTFTPTAAQAYNGNYGSSGTNVATAYMQFTGTGTVPSMALTYYTQGGNSTLGVVGRFSDSGRWPSYKNTGTGPVVITAHTATGAFWAWQGGYPGYCTPGQVVAVGESCATFVGLNTDVGDYATTETLSYTDTSSSTVYQVTNAYTGSVRRASVDRTSVAFGTVAQNQWTAPVNVRVTNNATNNPLRALSVSLSGGNTANFAIGAYSCTDGIAGGSYCDIPVSFKPTSSTNGYATTLVIKGTYPRMDPNETTYMTNPDNENMSVALSGSGGFSQATLTSSASQDFGVLWMNGPASSLSWTYRNDGNAPMTLTNPGLSAPLAAGANTCTNVAPGASCSFQVINNWNNDSAPVSQTFTPTGATIAPATATAYYTVYSAVPIWGNTTVAFGNVAVGSSATLPVTLYNHGAHVPYNWTGAGIVIINLPAEFTVNLADCSNVAPGPGGGQRGGSCTAYVTFRPTVVGARGGGSIYVNASSYAMAGTYATFMGTGQ